MIMFWFLAALIGAYVVYHLFGLLARLAAHVVAVCGLGLLIFLAYLITNLVHPA